MNAFRVIQISDTHLSRPKPWFVPNFEAMARIISERRPDLVINTGDIALDGADLEDDLTFARDCHATIDVPSARSPAITTSATIPGGPRLSSPSPRHGSGGIGGTSGTTIGSSMPGPGC